MLGYAPNRAAAAVGLSAAALEGLDEPRSDPQIPAREFQSRATGWQPTLPALEAAFGIALVVRLRASAVAQRVVHSGEDAPDGVEAVYRAVLQAEQIEWIRWAAEQPELRDLQDGQSTFVPSTRARLVRVMELATLDDQQLRVALFKLPSRGTMR